jgi:hypothetical protein
VAFACTCRLARQRRGLGTFHMSADRTGYYDILSASAASVALNGTAPGEGPAEGARSHLPTWTCWVDLRVQTATRCTCSQRCSLAEPHVSYGHYGGRQARHLRQCGRRGGTETHPSQPGRRTASWAAAVGMVRAGTSE